MRDCLQYPLEGHSEISNDQALLNPFDHYIKIKTYMRVVPPPHLLNPFDGGALYPGVDRPPPHIDYVHRDEI